MSFCVLRSCCYNIMEGNLRVAAILDEIFAESTDDDSSVEEINHPRGCELEIDLMYVAISHLSLNASG